MLSTFYETKKCFKSYIQYTRPLSYDDWKALPGDHKAAALFVQFFDSIICAWNKAKSYDGDDEEAVETIIQYLLKNVPIIEKDAKRFNASYVGRVAYNCCYCICHDRKCDKERRENEVSAIQVDADGTEYNILDSFISHENPIEAEMYSKQFWAMIEDFDEDSKTLVARIISLGKVPARLSPKNAETLEKIRRKCSIFLDVNF